MVPEFPERPAPPRSALVRLRSWVEWIGAGRLVASAVVVLAVIAGAYWLVKPPPATTESKLPYAGTATTAPNASPASPVTATTGVAVPSTLVVHVAGAVQAPGVYQLPAGARAVDAVQAAGGLAADANSDAINLAAPLADGQRVYVPRVGEAVPVVVGGSSGAAESSGAAAATGPVNLNSATADDLDSLPGVGPSTAAAILAYRDQHGPFASVEALADVRGIGPAKLEALRGLVTV
ncbi:MAG: ComEA family DNA-binding protein [Ilumatobacteraceae bacterium]